jgi:hypothetical protein
MQSHLNLKVNQAGGTKGEVVYPETSSVAQTICSPVFFFKKMKLQNC